MAYKKKTKAKPGIQLWKKSSGKKKKSRKKGAGKKRRNSRGNWLQIFLVILLLSASLCVGKHYFLDVSLEQARRIKAAQQERAGEDGVLEKEEGTLGRPEILQDFLTVNSYSRSGIKIGRVRGIVIHYVANPGSTARENRDYFEDLKDTHTTKASSHYVIGLEGEIIQCIPLDEISYASNQRNHDTISIECCHPGEDGQFTEETYNSLTALTAWLCDTYGLSSDQIIRHYDVTGKLCPLYYVEHPDQWEDFKENVQDILNK